MVHKDVFDNGVRVVTEKMSSVRSVSIGVWVNVGSRDEEPGEEGFSHFIDVRPRPSRAKLTRWAES